MNKATLKKKMRPYWKKFLKLPREIRISSFFALCIIAVVTPVFIIYNSFGATAGRALKSGVRCQYSTFSKYLTQGTGEQLLENVNAYYSGSEKYQAEAQKKMTDTFGAKIKVKTKIIYKNRLDKADLKKIKDKYMTLYGEEIKSAYKVTAEYSIKGAKKQKIETIDFVMIKHKGDWYLENYELISKRAVYL